MSDNTVHIDPSRARHWAASVLQHAGVPSAAASTVASILVLADLRGVDTHGINRLPSYLARIHAGSLNPAPSLVVQQKTPVMALIDAQDGFGFVAGHLATSHAIEMAKTFGVGIVGVRNSSHFGMAAAYVLQAIEAGYAAQVFSNAPPAMPPWGSRQALWGTNPIAVGFPGGKLGDYVLDMTPSVVARGKVIKAARRGEPIPEGWMLDAEGLPTTDAGEALKGTVLPIGGPKGSGLAAMVDIFAGLLTGASFAGEVKNGNLDPSKPTDTGHWFMVFKPEVFLDSREEYLERMDTLMSTARGCDLAAGVTQIHMPGERSTRMQELRSKSGIPITRQELSLLHKMAVDVGYTEELV